MDIKERIKSLCKERGITGKQLEIELNLGVGYISKIGKSSNKPKTEYVQKIADYFNKTTDYILYGDRRFDAEDSVLLARASNDPKKMEIITEMFQLSPENLNEFSNYLEFLLNKQEKGEN